MNKLEVGMYYRYKETIGKYIKPDLGPSYFTNQNKYGWHEIANGGSFSFNIIDLVQVGDYVNGRKVREIRDICGKEILFYYDYNNSYDEKYIKSIVTKEQFESMEYKLGDINE